MDESREEDAPSDGGEIAALEIVGVFLSVLGVAMIVAAFWPPTWSGKLVNLVAAALLLGIGLAMFWYGRVARRARQDKGARDTSETTPPQPME